MSNDKNKQQDGDKDKDKDKNEMDKELRQTFPASDPPSHSRPGHERSEDDES